jgi:putative ABC transport system permease protein
MPFGAIAGVFASRHALVGLAGKIDPRPGSIVMNWFIVIALMAVALAVGVVVLVVATERATSTRAPAAVMPPTEGLWRPLPVSIGVRNAFFASPRHGGRASRAALLIATMSVAAIVAALSVSASIANLQDDPTLSGQSDNRFVDSGESTDVYDRAFPMLERDNRVAVLAGLHVLFDLEVDSSEHVAALAFDIVRGQPHFSVARGRVPYQSDELALGPTTLERLGKAVGDTATITGPHGRSGYTIVGVALFPEGDFSHDEGIALTVDGANRVAGDVHEAGAIHRVLFDWANGIDTAAADYELACEGFQVVTEEQGLEPAAVTNLGQVRSLPIALAAFVGLLALGTLTQAIATFTKMQHREFATMRALGAKPRTVSALVVIHSALIAVVALAIGAPAGAVVGAQVWRPIADSADVVVDTISPWGWITVMSGVALVASTLLVTPLALRAMWREPAPFLRAE